VTAALEQLLLIFPLFVYQLEMGRVKWFFIIRKKKEKKASSLDG